MRRVCTGRGTPVHYAQAVSEREARPGSRRRRVRTVSQVHYELAGRLSWEGDTVQGQGGGGGGGGGGRCVPGTL